MLQIGCNQSEIFRCLGAVSSEVCFYVFETSPAGALARKKFILPLLAGFCPLLFCPLLLFLLVKPQQLYSHLFRLVICYSQQFSSCTRLLHILPLPQQQHLSFIHCWEGRGRQILWESCFDISLAGVYTKGLSPKQFCFFSLVFWFSSISLSL